MVFGLVLVGHSGLPSVLIEGLEHVLQKKPDNIQAVCVDPAWCAGDCQAEVNRAIEAVKGDEGVVILTDLIGATPDRGAKRCRWPDADVISGMNMALIVSLYNYRERFMKKDAINKAIEDAQSNIIQRQKQPALSDKNTHLPNLNNQPNIFYPSKPYNNSPYHTSSDSDLSPTPSLKQNQHSHPLHSR